MEQPTHDRTVHDIAMSDIYADSDFNCRGKISPLEVVDLARDIMTNGLDVPITVRPYDKGGFKYIIVAGHRRYMAFRVNQTPTIPATIRKDLDDFTAAGLNLRENILRSELNMVQEARGVRKFMMAGWTENSVADFLKQSRGWVQIRFIILKLPEDIQNEIAAGFFTQDQIRKIYAKKGEAQYALVRAIKEAKIKGDKIDLKPVADRDPLKASKRPQDRTVMFEMINHLLSNFGGSLHTRLLAWAAGEINDWQIHEDIVKYAAELGVPYTIPQNVRDAFKKKFDVE